MDFVIYVSEICHFLCLSLMRSFLELRCGDFLSEKSCRHKLVLSTGFWSWLLNVSSVLTYLKYTAAIFGLSMPCGYASRSWE